ncbi:MAG: leucine-rich repeat domain-containing protein, partial [Eubacterium sp.]
IVMMLSVLAGIDFSAQAEAFSGECGSNLVWSVDSSSGVLTISGSGKMDNYDGGAPWSKGDFTVKTVKVSSGVTSIGDCAFYDCKNMTGISLPNTITSIGERAFYNCSSLTKIVIPSGVKSLGDYAFANCKKLSSVTVPSTVKTFGENSWTVGGAVFSNCPLLKTAGNLSSNANIKFGWTESIPSRAFSYCSSLTSISIPSSITKIGSYAFKACKKLTKISISKNVSSIGTGAFNDCTALTTITVNKDNKNYSSSDGDLFNKNKTQLIQYATGKTSTKYTVAKSVTKIAYAAFAESSKLQSITLPSNLKSIGNYAFANDTKLTAITIPSKVTTIGLRAFNYCTALKSIDIPDEVNEIAVSTFANCDNLTSVKIGDGVKTIDYNAFSYCKNLKSIDFGNGVETIYDCIYGCKKLTSISLPSSVKEITDGAFSGNEYLKTVEIKSGNIRDGAFSCCSNLTMLTLGNKVKTIGAYAFAGCEKLKDVKIPDSVTKLDEAAFAGCKALKSADVGASVTKIVYNTFRDCSSLSEVRVLNPKSKIDDKKETIPQKATIYGYKNSTAQSYAEKYNREFIALIDASNYKVTLSNTSYVYDGKVKKPSVTVKTANGKTISSKYYDVVYDPDRKNPGTYTVTVTFKHQYVGTIKKSFTIKPKSTSISSVTAKSKGFTVKWKKQSSQTTGYEIQYSTSSKFTNAKTVTVS